MSKGRVEPGTNPLRQWLDDHKVTAKEFSVIANVDAAYVYSVLQGYALTLPKRFANAISAYGDDGADVADKYDRWRSQMRDQLMAEIRARLMAQK